MESDWIFQEVGSAINDLIERFISEPFFFYAEQDMHAYVYHKLISGKLGEERVETYFGDKTVLLHREYPTLNTYPGARGKPTRGHFDLAVIDPAHAPESHWRTHVTQPRYARHRPKVAIEFGLNEIGTTRLDLTHFKKDFTRLTDRENLVERGYLLFFVRTEDFPEGSGMRRIIDRLPTALTNFFEERRDRASNLVVVYTECRKPHSRFVQVIPKSRSDWISS